MGDAAMPRETTASSSASVRATPPPVPPRVKAGRTIAGNPTRSIAARASPTLCTIALTGTLSPASVIVSRKRSRSSARSIAS